MQFRQFLRNGESKPCSAEASCRAAVHLPKLVKDMGLRILGDADTSVSDCDAHALR